MDSLDVELLIREIRKRPALWDTSFEGYKNRQMQKDGWAEVCSIVIPGFTEKNGTEKVQIERDIRIKWRHIRDAFVRQTRVSTRKRSEDNTKTVRSYIYAKHLKFLKNIVNTHRNENLLPSSSRNANIDHIEVEAENSEIKNFQVPSSRVTTLFTRRKGCLKNNLKYIDSEQHQSQKKQINVEENEDMIFFRSLQSTLQTLRPDQKLRFRIDVMSLLTAYVRPPAQNPKEHTPSDQSPPFLSDIDSHVNVAKPSSEKAQYTSTKKEQPPLSSTEPEATCLPVLIDSDSVL